MYFVKIKSHVISSVIHITHEYDQESKPWPLEIENHKTGQLDRVYLEPGEMMFYESSKCLHGRMSELKGKYYGSLYVHYAPVNEKIWNYTIDDVTNAIPPHWHVVIDYSGESEYYAGYVSKLSYYMMYAFSY